MELNQLRKLANSFISFYKVKKWNSQIWFNKNKKWISNYDISLEAMLDNYLLTEWNIELESKAFNDVKSRIEHTLELDKEIIIDNTSPIVYVDNGYLTANKFIKYTKEQREQMGFIPFTINVEYIQEDKLDKTHYKKVKTFIDNVFLTEDTKKVREAERDYFLAHCFLMLSSYQAKNLLIIAGDSNTGKSKLAKLITNLGRNYINSFNPEIVDNFFYAGFLNKTGAIAPDIRASWLEPTMIKKITGDDLTEINQKHKPTFNAELYTTPLLFTNTDIGYKELSNALTNRIVIIETYIDFIQNKKLGMSKMEADKLINDSRTPAIFLSLCYEAFKKTLDKETGLLIEPASSKILKLDIEANNNKIYTWLEETKWLDNEINNTYTMIHSKKVYDAYLQYYKTNHDNKDTGLKYTREGLWEEFKQCLKTKYKNKYKINWLNRSTTTEEGKMYNAYKVELIKPEQLNSQDVLMLLNRLYEEHKQLKQQLEDNQNTINRLKAIKKQQDIEFNKKRDKQEQEIKQLAKKTSKTANVNNDTELVDIKDINWGACFGDNGKTGE